jgi:2-oxoglutarate ferredoxin oxidoreductase subunit delta
MGTPKKLVTNKKWCKGCGICVEFCPKNVLELKNGIIDIARPDDCISCGMCELRCPDLAIFLEEVSHEQ